MKPLQLIVASTPDLAVYHLKGPVFIEHKSAFVPNNDALIEAMLKGLDSIPWLLLARRVHGLRTKGKRLRLTVYTPSASLIEAGAYLQSLEELPVNLRSTTQELWQQLRKYDVLWRKREPEDVQNLQQWAETAGAQ